MRILIVSLILLLAAFQVSGQKNSKVDPKDAQIDTLTTGNKTLTIQLDSVSKELVKYVGLYTAIKEKVLHYNFDPTRSAYLIDSLKASRDSISGILPAEPKSMAYADSISMLLKENIKLKAETDSLKTAMEKKLVVPSEELEKAKVVGYLKQLKELLDAKIISDAEFVTLKNKYLEKL
jgi:hypothetical protein